MDPAVATLAGVVVGVVLSAVFGTLRDRQERAHLLRAELRTERLAAITAFLAADDQFFLAHRGVSDLLIMMRPGDGTDQQRADLAAAWQKRDDAEREVGVALSRVRLLSPELRDHAQVLSDATRSYPTDHGQPVAPDERRFRGSERMLISAGI